MLDIVIGVAVALIVAVVAVFLILLAIDIALVRKLRSIIPLSPQAEPAAERPRARAAGKPAISLNTPTAPGNDKADRATA